VSFDSAPSPSRWTKRDIPRHVQLLAFGVPLYFLFIHLWTWHLTIPFIVSGRSDFRQFYAAGAMVRNGESHRLYEYQVQKSFQDALVSAQAAALPFISPAYDTVLFVPFSSLPYRGAFILFLVCNLVALAVLYLILRSWMRNLTAVYPLLPIGLFMGFLPVAYALIQGQDSLLLTTLLAGAFVFLTRERNFLSGILMGLGLFKFSLVLPIVLLFVIWRRWKVLAGFAIVAVILSGISIWIAGIAQTRLYLHSLFAIAGLTPPVSDLSRYPITLQQMANLHGFVFGVSGNWFPKTWIHAITIFFAAVVMIWTAWRGGVIDRAAHQLLFAIPCSVLVSHHLYIHDLSVVLLPTIVLLDSFLPCEALGSNKGRVLACAASLMFVSPIIESFSASHFFVVAISVTILLISVAAAFSSSQVFGLAMSQT